MNLKSITIHSRKTITIMRTSDRNMLGLQFNCRQPMLSLNLSSHVSDLKESIMTMSKLWNKGRLKSRLSHKNQLQKIVKSNLISRRE
jgi:hypothetical protein